MATDIDEAKNSEGGAWEMIKVIIQALLIAFVIRTLLYQPFNIPSGSMVPTLREGDYLFVSKLSYGYSRYTFSWSIGESFKIAPFSFEGRVFEDRPKRGDVSVFKVPYDNTTDYIKRVVGLPGDQIQMIDSVLHINGEPVQKRKIKTLTKDFPLGTGNGVSKVDVYMETLPNGVEHLVYDTGPESLDNTQVFNVPPNHYFMMGDNRDNSLDSRTDRVSFVPFDNFVGRADVIFYSQVPTASFWQFWRWPQTVRWSRIFQTVD